MSVYVIIRCHRNKNQRLKKGENIGGIGTAISVGLSAANLLTEAERSNKQMKQMQKEYQYNQKKRKNLLDAQLASRRASLSSMGLSSSKSAAAAQQREAQVGYDDLNYNNENFAYNYSQKQNEKERNFVSGIYSGITDTAGKILK